MYVGHVGVALGAKGVRPQVPLWTLVIAAQGPDWIDGCLLALGLGTDLTSQLSHSIPSAVAVALAIGYLTARAMRSSPAGWTVAVIYLLHLPADYITGRKPLFPGGPKVGFQLYSHAKWDLVLEVAVISIGWWYYRRSLPEERRNGLLVFVLPAVLFTIQLLADLIFSMRNHGFPV